MVSLAINSGSSSIKLKLFRGGLEEIAKVSVSEIGTDAARIHSRIKGQEKTEVVGCSTDYLKVFDRLLALIREAIDESIDLVAHRIVHGGSETEAIVIEHESHQEKEIMEKMGIISSFAPLHNYHAMLIVKRVLITLPTAKSVLCFDTLFHSTISKGKSTYLIPPPPSIKVELRRYGFHGLSYSSVLDQLENRLQKKKLNLIVLQLGSGCSICLILDGKSYDTTMGLTPLEGLPGSSRSGSVDPSLIFHYTENASELIELEGDSKISRGEMILNKESGWKGFTGISDFGIIIERAFGPAGKEQEKCLLAYQTFLGRVNGYMGSYISAAKGRLDGIAFSGGIGEHSDRVRRDVMDSLRWIEELAGTGGGIEEERNNFGSGLKEITRDGSKLRGFVVETDEEKELVRMGLSKVKE